MIRLSQYISYLNIRYGGGKNINKNLLDKTLNEFKMQVSVKELELPNEENMDK